MAVTNEQIFKQLEKMILKLNVIMQNMLEIEENLNDTQITIGRALKVMAIELIEDFEEIDFGPGFDDFEF